MVWIDLADSRIQNLPVEAAGAHDRLMLQQVVA